MHKVTLTFAACALFISPANAAGPRFGTAVGIGSTTSTYSSGEPSGGTYSVNGATGAATFASLNTLGISVGAPPNILAAGPSAISGSNQQIDWVLANSTADKSSLIGAGGYWSSSNYVAFGLNRSFTSANTGATNNITAFIQGEMNGSQSTLVPLVTFARARTSNTTVFGGNFIANADSGTTGVKMVGAEIDVEPSAGVTAAAGSGALFINMFNTALPGPAIQIGAVSGGSFNNGIGVGGIASNGAGLFSTGGTMSSLVNPSGGTYNLAAIALGTGVSQGVSFGTDGSGNSPYIYGTAGTNLLIQFGSSGGFVLVDKTGVNNLAAFTASTPNSVRETLAGVLRLTPFTVSTLGTADPSPAQGDIGIVTDATTCTKNAAVTGGGSTFCVVVYNSGWKGI